jgi:DNA polymerase III gamma/tau subunit
MDHFNLQEIYNKKVFKFLSNAIKKESINSSYIFSGTEVRDKIILTKYLAGYLNCTNLQDKPCGVCSKCKSIQEDKSCLIRFISKDDNVGTNDKKKTNISVDTIRNLIKEILEGAYQGHLLIYIKKAESLSPSALNSLLKILENIPKKIIFIFEVFTPYSLLSTIRSRSQVIHFGNPEKIETEKNLTELISIDKFQSFLDNYNIDEILCHIEVNNFDRNTVKDFLNTLEIYYIEIFKEKNINKYVEMSIIIRKYSSYLNRPVNIINNLYLMFLELKNI